jgi:uncharacterized membrane protein YdbT with pleckstrin-like domain
MGFVEKNLTANETIQYTGKLHWYIYVRGIVIIIIAALCLKEFPAMGAFLLFLGIGSLLFAMILSRSSEFVVTNRRVILKTGFVKRKMTELQVNKSEGMMIEQGIMGRMLNFGSIKITTGGVSEAFPFVKEPFEFKKAVNQSIENSFNGSTGNPQVAY